MITVEVLQLNKSRMIAVKHRGEAATLNSRAVEHRGGGGGAAIVICYLWDL
jgi:hypothetical protein